MTESHMINIVQDKNNYIFSVFLAKHETHYRLIINVNGKYIVGSSSKSAFVNNIVTSGNWFIFMDCRSEEDEDQSLVRIDGIPDDLVWLDTCDKDQFTFFGFKKSFLYNLDNIVEVMYNGPINK